MSSEKEPPAAKLLQKDDDGPSLMEQMLAEATAAKEAEKKRKAAAARKQAKSEFGSGLRRGFLTSSSKKKRPASSKKTTKAERKPAAPPAAASSTASGKKARAREAEPEEVHVGNGAAVGAGRGMVLEEVQRALDEGLAEKLEKDQSWMNESLVKTMMENPVLAKGLLNPRMGAAFAAMQKNPAAVMEQAKSDPELQAFVQEFMRVMGDHFTALGEAKARAEAGSASDGQQKAAAGQAPIPTPDQLPPDTDPEVRRVLQDSELRAILGDPRTQEVLRQCGDPRKLRHYMQDPEFGPKIEKLRRAGLVQIQR